MVRFYAEYRIKQHASLRLLRDRLIFLVSVLQPYSQGGMVIVLTTPLIFYKTNNYHSSLTVGGAWVSNPISYSYLRISALIINGKKSFRLEHSI